MNPSWYDLLDVAPDATEDEIKSAWKTAVVDLDPTDRKFRVYNQAAEVLLEPRRRAGYDAELAAAERAEADADAETDLTGESEPSERAAAPTYAAPTYVPGGAAAPARRTVPGWLLAVVAALTAVAVGACSYVWFEKPSDVSVDDSTRAAQSAAERAIGPILSYNALHLDEDQKAAESYMTAKYRKDYDDLFAVIKQNAPATKTIVKAQVIASGVVRSGEDRVDVLLFVNRPTTNKLLSEPVVYKDQVTVTMQKVDGDWLVDDLVTSPVAR